jgi:hypothetical protein
MACRSLATSHRSALPPPLQLKNGPHGKMRAQIKNYGKMRAQIKNYKMRAHKKLW